MGLFGRPDGFERKIAVEECWCLDAWMWTGFRGIGTHVSGELCLLRGGAMRHELGWLGLCPVRYDVRFDAHPRLSVSCSVLRVETTVVQLVTTRQRNGGLR